MSVHCHAWNPGITHHRPRHFRATEQGQASIRTWHTEKTVGIDDRNPGITDSAGTEFASVRPRTSRDDRQMGDDSVRG
ncbi:hypothetical protein [Rhizobium sp. LC145]|uniref:hypothetical protein n=1 Tax=Rhizobium sp. LC145 TaxID=1120688 RepID=UPI000A4F32FE|nr:hypothetical protein [Rhizobium sp. LC145]TKT67184.1 hypothetical protein FDR95_03920 [Rhizobiaceae bacterium LC148]